jgi:hypothetical protein
LGPGVGAGGVLDLVVLEERASYSASMSWLIAVTELVISSISIGELPRSITTWGVSPLHARLMPATASSVKS